MALQPTYTQFQPAGYPGMHADMREWDGNTKTATATIAFGTPVQRSGENGCAPLTTGEYIGIAKAMHLVTGNGDSYAVGDNVPVVDEGAWYVMAGEAIAVGAAVNFDSATGRWTDAAVAGTVRAVPQAEAETAASGDGVIFKVRLRRIPS
jgi:hypothetical protein